MEYKDTIMAGMTEQQGIENSMETFLKSVQSFKDGCEKRLESTEKMIETFQLSQHRPFLSGKTDYMTNIAHKHQTAFNDYVRKGDDTALRGLDTKALSVAVDADGGYLISPQIATHIESLLREQSPLRSVVNVVETVSNSVEFLVDQGDMAATWVAEAGSRSETTTSAFAKIVIPAHEIFAMPKASQRLLDDTAFNIEEWIAGRIADKFARSENTAFVSGDGSGKPTGFLSKTKVANGSWSWGNLGYIATGHASNFASSNPHDVLIDLVYALKGGYRNGAVFVMNSKTAAVIRKMKDADGRYLWNDAYQAGLSGQASYLLGYPVLIVEDMPDIGADAYPIAFGNFKASYTVVDGRDIRTLRDPFSAKPHVLFYTTRRIGGDVTNFEGIKLLKCAVS